MEFKLRLTVSRIAPGVLASWCRKLHAGHTREKHLKVSGLLTIPNPPQQKLLWQLSTTAFWGKLSVLNIFEPSNFMKTSIKKQLLLPALIIGLGLMPAGRVIAQTLTHQHSLTAPSDRSWSFGESEICNDGISVIVELKPENDYDNIFLAKTPGVGMARGPLGVAKMGGSQIVLYGDLALLKKSDLKDVSTSWPSSRRRVADCVFNAGSADEVASLRALAEDYIMWESKPHEAGPSGYPPPPGIKVFHGATEDYTVKYSGGSPRSLSVGQIWLKDSNRHAFAIEQPAALAFVVKSIPELLRIRDEALARKEKQQVAQKKAQEEKTLQEVNAEKEASAQRLKKFQNQEEAKANLVEKQKQLDEIHAQEEVKKAEIARQVQMQKSAKILDYLATTKGQKLCKIIEPLSEAIHKRYKEERKPIDDLAENLEKQYIAYLQSTVAPSVQEKQQAEEYQRQMIRARLNQSSFKESPELQKKDEELSKYLAEFEQDCGYSYDEAMKVKATTH